MDMRTDLTAVPHACLRNPNPERSRKVLKSLGVFKRKCGPKREAKPIRQSDDVPCVTAAALALYKKLQNFEGSRYVSERPHRYQCSMQASSLGWYLHEQPAPLLETKRKRKQFQRIPVTTRGTHTHRDSSLKMKGLVTLLMNHSLFADRHNWYFIEIYKCC